MTLHSRTTADAASTAPAKSSAQSATANDAQKFIESAETRLLDLWIRSMRANWVHETFITHDTEEMAAQADQNVKAATSNLSAESRRYEGLNLPEDVARKFYLLKHSVDIPAPRNPAEQKELSVIIASLGGDYGKG
ncbi:MAG TPA: M2 family metallopeptidase, partial [Candidatus Limnocylindria bacterium]|nr:M2 family metallopeptidase [Candidatus Limnocylindria bacterium]